MYLSISEKLRLPMTYRWSVQCGYIYPVWGLNPRPMAHETIALTTELTGLILMAMHGYYCPFMLI